MLSLVGHLLRLCRDIFVRQRIRIWLQPRLISGTVNACDPQNFEPNLALNLEIADLINSKKGNA